MPGHHSPPEGWVGAGAQRPEEVDTGRNRFVGWGELLPRVLHASPGPRRVWARGSGCPDCRRCFSIWPAQSQVCPEQQEHLP